MGNSLATRAQKCKISRTSSGLRSGALTNAYLNAPNFVRVLLCGNTMSYLEYLTSRVRCTGLTLKCVLVRTGRAKSRLMIFMVSPALLYNCTSPPSTDRIISNPEQQTEKKMEPIVAEYTSFKIQ